MRKKEKKSFNKELFGKRIKALRNQLDIIQDEFASNINRTRGAYVLMEKGKSSPSLDCLVDIIEFLEKRGFKVSMDYLAGRADHPNGDGAFKELSEKYEAMRRDYESVLRISNLQEQLLNIKK